MRISDWSSDVCFSDLFACCGSAACCPKPTTCLRCASKCNGSGRLRCARWQWRRVTNAAAAWRDRKRDVQGKRVTVRVHLVCRRSIKKHTTCSRDMDDAQHTQMTLDSF